MFWNRKVKEPPKKSPMLIKVMGIYGGLGYEILEDVPGKYLIMGALSGENEGCRVRLSYFDGFGGGGVKEYHEGA